MKICENCGKEHDGTYGSGRFCSVKCSRGFSTKAKRKEINEKVRKKLKKNPIYYKICPICKHEFIAVKEKHVCCSASCASTKRNLTPENIKKHSEIAKRLFVGNRNKYAYGWYESNIAGKVFLESSYELKVAKELDKHNINWNRPKHLHWINEKGESKRYFPDFYLIDYDIYLDPKNQYLIKIDENKINEVIKQNNIKLLVLDKNNLTWADIKNKIEQGRRTGR